MIKARSTSAICSLRSIGSSIKVGVGGATGEEGAGAKSAERSSSSVTVRASSSAESGAISVGRAATASSEL